MAKFPITLTPEQAAKARFPPGCPVFYGFQRLSKPSPHGETWAASEGVVASVAYDAEQRRFQIQVARRGAVDYEPDAATEGDVAFAAKCPVTVAPLPPPDRWCLPDACGLFGEVEEPVGPVAGRVLRAYPVFDGRTGRLTGMTYDVECDYGDTGWLTEEKVAAERLSFAAGPDPGAAARSAAVARDADNTEGERARGNTGALLDADVREGAAESSLATAMADGADEASILTESFARRSLVTDPAIYDAADGAEACLRALVDADRRLMAQWFQQSSSAATAMDATARLLAEGGAVFGAHEGAEEARFLEQELLAA